MGPASPRGMEPPSEPIGNFWNQDLGELGEKLAQDFLKESGYRVLFSRYRTKYGEIDIVALKNKVLTFIEVKTRNSDKFGDPLEAVTPWKIRHLKRATWAFLLDYPHCLECYDIELAAVAVRLYREDPEERVEMVSIY